MSTDQLYVQGLQRYLNAHGYNAGPVDGHWGPRTETARQALSASTTPDHWPLDDDSHLNDFYGPRGDHSHHSLYALTPPYPMVLAWQPDIAVRIIRCHELVANSLRTCLQEIEKYCEHDQDKIQHHGLHLYGGCYSPRKMRGSDRWSRHYWGIAIDLDPERNGLRTPWPSVATMPQFAVEIFVDSGWVSGAAHWGRDAMHFQATFITESLKRRSRL